KGQVAYRSAGGPGKKSPAPGAWAEGRPRRGRCSEGDPERDSDCQVNPGLGGAGWRSPGETVWAVVGGEFGLAVVRRRDHCTARTACELFRKLCANGRPTHNLRRSRSRRPAVSDLSGGVVESDARCRNVGFTGGVG